MHKKGKYETVFALASGFGKAGIAVFRISGPSAKSVLKTISKTKGIPVPRKAKKARLFCPDSNELLDEGIVIYFPAPSSFTGEDVVELHVHGGRAVIAGLIKALSRIEDVRMAEPGEFTRRAFDNSKLDLTAAEGLADLINAETEVQRRQAQRQLQGELGLVYDNWRNRLLTTMALLEAEIDFSDEDLPAGINEKALEEVQDITGEISAHLNDNRQGQVLRDGLHVAILGPPNAGKSSLLNRLARRDIAIVSEKAGTTRDVIEVYVELDGYPVILADTAGLRESKDETEAEGVRRAEKRASDADLKLAVFDGAKWPQKDFQTSKLIDENTITVLNKSDLLSSVDTDSVLVSALTGDGFDELLKTLKIKVAAKCQISATPSITRSRHRRALEKCLKNLLNFCQDKETELRAEDLRLASRALGEITGSVNVEEVLDVIFKEFCIGK